MNNIEKQFDDLLKTVDKIADIYNDENVSDEKLDELLKSLDTDESQKFPSNNGQLFNENTDPSQNKTETVLVSANPLTGVLNTIPYNQDNLTEESIDNLINMQNEDLNKIEIGWDQFVEYTESMYPDADEEGLKQLLNCVNKYRAKIKFPYFNELPEFIKKEINSYVNLGAAEHGASGNTTKQLKNMLAKELYDSIITNNYSSKAFTDISKFYTNEINKNKEELEKSVGNYNTKLRKEYEEGFLKKADELDSKGDEESKEVANNLRKTSKMFTQSYTYENMYEAYKNRKIKIKNIQIDKFKRTCQEFNRKYYNATFEIKDVGMVVPVLDRILDKKYDMDIIKKFVVCFINYTKDFTPNNVDEHVFMFYFIQHILALDIKIPGDEYEEFNKIVKENIHKFLDLIIERDLERKQNE